jgi:hypothetical protein
VKRRTFIAGLGGAAAWPLAARAQQQALPVVAFIRGGSADTSVSRVRSFRKGRRATDPGRLLTSSRRRRNTASLPVASTNRLGNYATARLSPRAEAMAEKMLFPVTGPDCYTNVCCVSYFTLLSRQSCYPAQGASGLRPPFLQMGRHT